MLRAAARACSRLAPRRALSGSRAAPPADAAQFHRVCGETLDSLAEHFEELVERAPELKGADVTFADGVLTVALGGGRGTYVINRQSPNRQIWLSSPVSGPRRFELAPGGHWACARDGEPLHRLLQREMARFTREVDFGACAHSLL